VGTPEEFLGILKSGANPYSRLCIGTPTLGTIRMEWHQARISLIMPVNWAEVRVMQNMPGFMPLGFLVADAQNLIVRHAIDQDSEWLLLYEDDVLPPLDAFVRLNEYMMDGGTPIVSGLYYTKSRPSEPLIFRGRGNGYYPKWKRGDLVWADGVPTGFLLIHMSIMKALWEDSEAYIVRGQETRRVFHFPRDMWQDPETGNYKTMHGTSDLAWCSRIIEGGYFKKAGWPKYQRKKYPFLVDTNIFCRHISPNGELFP